MGQNFAFSISWSLFVIPSWKLVVRFPFFVQIIEIPQLCVIRLRYRGLRFHFYIKHSFFLHLTSTTLNLVAFQRIFECQFFSKYISEVEGFLRKQSLKFFMSPLWIQSCLRFATYQKHSTVHLAGLGSEDGVSSTREPPAWDYISMSLCLYLFLYICHRPPVWD